MQEKRVSHLSTIVSPSTSPPNFLRFVKLFLLTKHLVRKAAKQSHIFLLKYILLLFRLFLMAEKKHYFKRFFGKCIIKVYFLELCLLLISTSPLLPLSPGSKEYISKYISGKFISIFSSSLNCILLLTSTPPLPPLSSSSKGMLLATRSN